MTSSPKDNYVMKMHFGSGSHMKYNLFQSNLNTSLNAATNDLDNNYEKPSLNDSMFDDWDY